jgi:hypothetical protein
MFPSVINDITTGNLLTIFAVVGSVFTFIWAMKADIGIVKRDIDYLQQSHKALTEAFNQLGKILTQVAVQDQRINMLEKRVDELSHGKGYVKE